MTRLRFAPPPTGSLFLGSARVALANQLYAQRHHGHLLLRLDDLTDPGQPEAIIQDLTWIGVVWHDVMRQSDRRDRYAEAFARLEREGFVYPCFESEEELKAKESFRRRRGQSAIYDRAMLRLTPKQRQDAEAGGKKPYWRLKLSGRDIGWTDMVQGKREAHLATVSDPVLMLADGTPSPILASVVDDIDNRTTHIVRGEESPGNTAIQIELFEILTGRADQVRFGHLPLLAEGKAAAGGRVSLRSLRQDGMEPATVAECLIGPAARGAPFRLADLKDSRFDIRRLLAANRSALSHLSFTEVADRLPAGATEAFWLAVRSSLDLLKEARGWWEVVAGTIVPPVVEGEHDLLRQAAALLPAEPWDHDVWGRWTGALAAATGRDHAGIEAPLRLALTGEDSGPDLADLLPLIGRARAVTRLEIAAA